jgi:hypothetical protein
MTPAAERAERENVERWMRDPSAMRPRKPLREAAAHARRPLDLAIPDEPPERDHDPAQAAKAIVADAVPIPLLAGQLLADVGVVPQNDDAGQRSANRRRGRERSAGRLGRIERVLALDVAGPIASV